MESCTVLKIWQGRVVMAPSILQAVSTFEQSLQDRQQVEQPIGTEICKTENRTESENHQSIM
jgi:hypothetical protein